MALRRSDIDLEHGTLVVQRELVKVKGGTIFQSTKTKTPTGWFRSGNGVRTVLLNHHDSQKIS